MPNKKKPNNALAEIQEIRTDLRKIQEAISDAAAKTSADLENVYDEFIRFKQQQDRIERNIQDIWQILAALSKAYAAQAKK